MATSWCWWTNHEWEAYSDEHSTMIEEAFVEGSSSMILDLFGVEYKVDLVRMVQVNRMTGFPRAVWRCSEEVPSDSELHQWTLNGAPLDLVTCAYLSTRRHQGWTSCKLWVWTKLCDFNFSTMEATYGTNRKVKKLGLQDCIPKMPTAQGLLESDMLEERPSNPEETCCVCLDGFPEAPAVRLIRCTGHWFHKTCIERACQRRAKCPYCSEQYAPAVGAQPPGQMTVKRRSQEHLAGFEESGVIEIQYILPSGYQSHSHPHPGAPYYGTARTAYLPDTPEGNAVLSKFKTAWRRRIIFTVGRSMTTGLDDCVVWNGIHHKTEMEGGSAHAYPDNTYLARVTQELSSFGIV